MNEKSALVVTTIQESAPNFLTYKFQIKTVTVMCFYMNKNYFPFYQTPIINVAREDNWSYDAHEVPFTFHFDLELEILSDKSI